MPTYNNTTTAGRMTELIVANCLAPRNLKLLTKNYRCHYGEIDLIAYTTKQNQDLASLVFIEVKFRHKNQLNIHPIETITPLKQKKLYTTANYFIYKHPKYANLPMQFDIAALRTCQNQTLKLSWLANAF